MPWNQLLSSMMAFIILSETLTPKLARYISRLILNYQLSHKNAQSEVTLESKKSLADPELLHDVMHITLCEP